MRTFDSCSLCLQRARDPVACTRGHIYCKECIYSDLLSQRKEIKRYQAKLDALAREEEEERDNAKNRARERVVADFEKNQLGLGVKRKETEGSSKPDASLEGAFTYITLPFTPRLILTLTTIIITQHPEASNASSPYSTKRLWINSLKRLKRLP